MRARISLPAQTLDLLDDRGSRLSRYSISTARNGPGELAGSQCTPRGRHIVRAKVGAGATAGTVFRGRRPTGEIWSPALDAAEPGRDWILSRLLWLSGIRVGANRLGEVDTMRRYIYIHGAPDSEPMGVPASHGCVRMRNADVIELFDRLPAYSRVDIDDFRVETGDWATLGDRARPLREEVFVLEQNVPRELEWDEADTTSRHVVALDAGSRTIGTGRLLSDGHIGRMAVAAAWRGQGVGAALMETLLAEAAQHTMDRLQLHAQTHATGFYARHGFVAVGDEYLEAGIPHRTMVLERRPG